MIYAICGTPGSFKSCYAVEKFLIPALAKGRDVYTNIEGLNPAYIATYFSLDPVEVDSHLHVLGVVYDADGVPHEDPDRVRNFYEDLPLNALVILDEAQNYYNSRDFKEGYSAKLIPWLTKHRHLGNDVVWICQALDSVDITFRRNTHLTYALKRRENIGLKNSSFVYVFDRADTERRHLTRSGYSPNPDIFKCYSSYVSNEVEEKRQSYNIILRSPFLWLFIIALGFAVYQVLSGGLSRVVGGNAHQKKEVKQKVLEKKDSVEKKDELNQGYVIEGDLPCILRTSRAHGHTVYYFSDGGYGYDNSGRVPCPAAGN